MVLQFVSMLLLQDQHLPLRIYLNVIIKLQIFSDGLSDANILPIYIDANISVLC